MSSHSPGTRTISRTASGLALLVLVAIPPAMSGGGAAAQTRPAVQSTRLYVMDCGLLLRGDPMMRFGLTTEQVGGRVDFMTPCLLVVHPGGTMLWDTGMIPDRLIKPGTNTTILAGRTPGWTTEQVFKEPGDTIGPSIVNRSLKDQLAEIGYTPADITYLVLSHMHVDHVANANDYARSTWITQKAERDAMFSERGRASATFANYSALEHAKTKVIEGDYDVFGDGVVRLISTPGHSPGHQSLLLRLARTGPLLITGDLYHYEAERALGIVPPPSQNKDQERASRAKVERLLEETGATLWVQHSLPLWRTLKKSPQYYD
jgi:glyoxylase-like metal-dependent hydrolase (beta-lactamase superfamily II)